MSKEHDDKRQSSGESDIDDQEFEEFLDWRSKKAWQ